MKKQQRRSQVNEVPESRQRTSHELSGKGEMSHQLVQKETTKGKTKTDIDNNFTTPYNSEQLTKRNI